MWFVIKSINGENNLRFIVLLLRNDVGFDLFSDFIHAVIFSDRFVGIKSAPNNLLQLKKKENQEDYIFSILKVLEDIM